MEGIRSWDQNETEFIRSKGDVIFWTDAYCGDSRWFTWLLLNEAEDDIGRDQLLVVKHDPVADLLPDMVYSWLHHHLMALFQY